MRGQRFAGPAGIPLPRQDSPGINAIVHLAGLPRARVWAPPNKQSSRGHGTFQLSQNGPRSLRLSLGQCQGAGPQGKPGAMVWWWAVWLGEWL